MTDIIQRDGTWTFDMDVLRLVPGTDRTVAPLRRALGELTVPLDALGGVAFERGRRSGRLRLRLREGADPLLQAARGKLPEGSDPYVLTVEPDRYGVAEYLVDEITNALRLAGTPADPAPGYLLPGPAVPVSVTGGDGSVTFDGETVRIDWNWKTSESKSAGGPRTLPLAEITAVEWQPSAGLQNGWLRFRVRGETAVVAPKHDPHAVELWGFKKDSLTMLAAAAVQARLPHPYAPHPAAGQQGAIPAAPAPAEAAAEPAQAAGNGPESDHDALLRRLRELGELHRQSVLTDEEFSTAKQAVLRRL